jgi:hypothetical protein
MIAVSVIAIGNMIGMISADMPIPPSSSISMPIGAAAARELRRHVASVFGIRARRRTG